MKTLLSQIEQGGRAHQWALLPASAWYPTRLQFFIGPFRRDSDWPYYLMADVMWITPLQ